jgi:hypothetical protein
MTCLRLFLLLLGLSACRADIDEMPEVYYRGPGSRLLCAVSADTSNSTLDSIVGGLERARRDRAVLQLYAHEPGRTISAARVEAILAAAEARGLETVTYAQLADGVAGRAGLALSFDDDSIDAWHDLAEVFERHHAHVTFFVSKYHQATAAQRAKLHDLARRGHDVQAHSVDHPHVAYATEHGVDGYVRDQLLPNLASLRADGFAPRVFAYPYGERTAALDRALLGHVALLRTTAYAARRDRDSCP